MLHLRLASKLERLQKIQTENDKVFRFGEVLLVRPHIFSRKLIPYDIKTGKKVEKMAMFENGKWMMVDVSTFKSTGIFSNEHEVWITGEEVN